MQHYKHTSGLTIIEGQRFFHKNNNYPVNWWKSDGPNDLEKMGFKPIPTPPVEKPEPVDPLTLPLTRRQLRLGLLALGVTSEQVVAAIKQETDAIKRETAMIEWEDAQLYHFDHPLVTLLMSKLGLAPAIAKAKWADMVGAE